MTLEVVVLGVSDVGRAKAFYEKLGWRLDAGRARAADRAARRLLPDVHCGFGQGIIQIRQPFGEGKTSPVAVEDVARVLAALLAHPQPHSARSIT